MLSGFLLSQDDEKLVLSLPTDTAKRVLAAGEIDELIPREQSTMPAGLLGQLENRQAFIDLAKLLFSINSGGTGELRRLKGEAGVN